MMQDYKTPLNTDKKEPAKDDKAAKQNLLPPAATPQQRQQLLPLQRLP